MTSPARTFVVGADGGNSKTDLVLAAVDGTVLARVTGAGTRPQQNGLEATARALAELARDARLRAGLTDDDRVVGATFYLANVDTDEDEDEMYDALRPLGIADRLDVGNDTAAVIKAGSTEGWGIAVVSGAGVNAVGVRRDGGTERFLAIGGLSGDWGGGWAVAEAGIGAAVRAADRRGPATMLRARVADAFGAPAEQVALDADRGVIPARDVFAFTPVVFATACDGDAVAISIVHRLADELLDFVRALVVRMDAADDAVDVVLGGGTLQSGNPVLLDRIRDGMAKFAPRARLQVLDVPPVAGAVADALATAGGDAAAADRMRAQLRVG